MKISPARAAAFDVLLRIFRDGAFSSILLPKIEAGLDPKDRALCHEIVLGVLRTKLRLDAAIDQFSKGRKIDLEVQLAAEIGLYQLHFLAKIPAHSAVNDSVALVQRAKKTSAKGFVNALLRAQERLFSGLTYVDEMERVSAETSHPAWLLEKWASERSFEYAACTAEANNARPKAAFRLTAKGRTEGLGIEPHWNPSPLVPGCFIADKTEARLRELAENGLVYFQDEGSQLIASLITLGPGDRFLDVSAAPGGKTTEIAARSHGALIIAGDIYHSRVRTLKSNCQQQGVENVAIVRYDAQRALPFREGEFHCVLVDAPCSGTGTIRSNPEIRYFLKPDDFIELQNKQLGILQNASKTVRPGGRLIYSTCSLETEENEAVVSPFLAANDAFESVVPPVPSEFLSSLGFLRTSPAEHGMDGFFAALMHRRS